MSTTKRVQPKNSHYRTGVSRKMYYGRANFFQDNFLAWLLKMTFQTIVFALIYFFFIEGVQRPYQNDPVGLFLTTFGYVFFWMILSDLIAQLPAYAIKKYYLKKKQKIARERERVSYGRWIWEYLFYTGFRTAFYICQLVALITMVLTPYLSFIAFVVAWMVVSILSIFISKALALWITKGG